MSTCISREGEYSEHAIPPAGPFWCTRCYVIDEQAIDAALEAAAQSVEVAADRAFQCPDLRCRARASGIEHAARIVRAQKRGAQ